MDPDPVPPRALPGAVAHVVALPGDGAVDRLVAAARRVLDACAPAVIVCDVGALRLEPRDGLRTLDLLVRLQLDARRRGSAIRLSRAGTDLRCLLDLAGMAAILPDHPRAG